LRHNLKPSFIFFAPVGDHPNLFQGDHPLADHPVQVREEGGDPLRFVNDLDDQGQVFGKPQNLGRVDAAVLPNPMIPRVTVAPARPRFRASSTMSS
jgi:hypothetical protein